MRHVILLSMLLVTACGAEAPTNESGRPVVIRSAEEALTFKGAARDRLCLLESDGRMGLISFAGTGQANCTVKGRLGDSTLQPDGDESCRITIDRKGDSITIASAGPGCAYYCGPGAALEGKTFIRMERPDPVTDLAGDPLC